MIKGIIFDLDGVITDTAHYHFIAWQNLAKEIGIEFDEVFNETLKGVSRMESLERILKLKNLNDKYTIEEKETLAHKKNEAYKKLIDNITSKDLLPGIKTLLDDLKANNIKIALASASKNALSILNHLDITSYFDYIVDASKIANSKPAPDTFLDALNGLNLKADEVIGVEDAKAGIESIKACNIKSIGINVKGDITLNSTKELTFDLLKTI